MIKTNKQKQKYIIEKKALNDIWATLSCKTLLLNKAGTFGVCKSHWSEDFRHRGKHRFWEHFLKEISMHFYFKPPYVSKDFERNQNETSPMDYID